MQERIRGLIYLTPTGAEIHEYLNKVKTNVRPLFAEEEIKPGTTRVRIVTEEGKFLGWGTVGEYDWFYLNKKSNGRTITHFSLHHGNSSTAHNMTMIDQPINIQTDEMNSIIAELTR